MTPCPEEMVLRIWGFWKDGVAFRPLGHTVEFFGSRPVEMNWDLKHHKVHRALGWVQHSMVFIGFKELCLSPRVALDRSQEFINPFVSEKKESACYCICICITVVSDIIMAVVYNSNNINRNKFRTNRKSRKKNIDEKLQKKKQSLYV